MLRRRFFRLAPVAFVLSVFGFAAPASDAALNSYLKIDGVEGGVTQKGREGTIEVNAVSWDVQRAGRGGALRFSNLRVLKPVDRSSPALFQAVTTNSTFASARLQLFTPTQQGGEVNYINYCLENVKIARIAMVIQDTKDPDLQRYEPREWVDLSFQRFGEHFLAPSIFAGWTLSPSGPWAGPCPTP